MGRVCYTVTMQEKPRMIDREGLVDTEQHVAASIGRRLKRLEKGSVQEIYPMMTEDGNDVIIRRAPARWLDRGRDGRPMQAVGQAVILLRDNHGEIFTAWSNGAITYEEVDNADVPAITLKLSPAPPGRLRAIAALLVEIEKKYSA